MEKSIPYPHDSGKSESNRSVAKSLIVAAAGVFSVFYLLNPGSGFVELIPDIIPGIGNLDEAAATAMLIGALAYFGFDLGRLFGRSSKKETGGSDDAVEVESEVVERD